MAVKITCIKKDGGNHENPYIAISSMSWLNEGSNQVGTSTRLEMYDFVVNKQGVAYVKDAHGNTANLMGAVSPNGKSYVKTIADNVKSDNLLKLPECR